MRHNHDRDYDHESLRDEREYGFYWYSGLWRIIRPLLVFLTSLLIVMGIVTSIWNGSIRMELPIFSRDRW